MGCGSSAPAATAPPQAVSGTNNKGRTNNNGGGTSINAGTAKETKNIDMALKRAKFEEEGKIKLLFLGAGESGKSTIFKQMRLLYGPGRSDEELRMFGVTARSNIVVAMRKLVILLRDSGLEGELDAESKNCAGENSMTPRKAYDELLKYLVEKAEPQNPPNTSGDWCGEDWCGESPRAGMAANKDAKQLILHHESIRILWECNTMKKVWDKRASANVVDGHKEFLDDVTRFAQLQYQPTKRDVLVARVRTTQVIVEKYRIKGMKYEMYDVGGQRSDRRKWLDCFDNVTAVIFVAALSEYDQQLAEADNNRMKEALQLFYSVINNRAFSNSSVLLFLNKKDVFKEKLQYSNIADQEPFDDYAGPVGDFDQGVLYFIRKFKEQLVDEELKDTFIHVTCATDTNDMDFVLDTSTTIIRSDNLRRAGFLLAD
mmetsp:Transcript_40652/g.69370  ORF Transcript_40652/g.69370 Transcript_40652/m.69370 type:complete len:429 (-) Transcript_40652:404-1690(-)